jgi:CubicO group peptidase (beta-lactamase class C family)
VRYPDRNRYVIAGQTPGSTPAMPPSRQMIRLIAALILVCAGVAKAEEPGSESGRVDRLFAEWDKSTSPGCAVGVMKDGRIIHERGYGMADLDHDVKISPTTVFHVASMSKQFTAAAILMLAHDGKISLDDPVRKYVPELPDLGGPITLRQLLHHTSGLRDQWELLVLAGWRYSLDLITDDDILVVLSRQKALNFAPGSKHLYSNSGYTLLAQVVKRVSGQSFRTYTSTRLFAPLGMSQSHFRDDHAEIVKQAAYGYAPSIDGLKLSITNFDTVGATSLLTTVRDLALWDENFYTARVGGRALIDQLQERGSLNDGTQLSYAAGLEIGKYRGLNIVSHAGSDAGYRANLIRFPDQHFSVAARGSFAEVRRDSAASGCSRPLQRKRQPDPVLARRPGQGDGSIRQHLPDLQFSFHALAVRRVLRASLSLPLVGRVARSAGWG